MATRLADLLPLEAITPRLVSQDHAGVLVELATLLAPHELIAQAQASADTARVQVASADRS